jgi:SAM-dependent methyltransferase
VTANEHRMAEELANYRNIENVHDLPDIYHVWSQNFLRPKLEALGHSSIPEIWVDVIARLGSAEDARSLALVSLGSGNCDVEIDLASRLYERGIDNFVFECLEINEDMLARGARLAGEKGLDRSLRFTHADLNTWEATGAIDVAFANHSLHHVAELEHLFGQVRDHLSPNGAFLISDMIGRNGHMRWPEALWLVHSIWENMPDRYKYNHQLRRVETMYENWDCSMSGFEGIRAQDILPLLMERFSFELFLGFANVVDVFVDRGFGHNFDPDSEQDVEFIRNVGALDDLTIELGMVKPTHMVAVLRTEDPARVPSCWRGWTPEFCVRRP